MKASTKGQRNILIVEDDLEQLNRYLGMARDGGLEADGVDTLDKAKGYLANRSYQYVLTDIHLNGPGRQDTFEGLEILREVKANHPETIVLAMSADPQIDTYNRVLREGAAYLFRKPILTEAELMIHLDVATKGRRVGKLARRRLQAQSLPPALLKRCPDGLVLPKDIRERARLAALSDFVPIIILGETGSGKEEVAKLVHRLRCEAQGTVPFVAINCANLTGDAAVSVLFGHRRGAFTGAEQTTAGFVGEADGGFLFLDEIHTLSLDCQKRLLRVLNDGSYTRLGDTQTLYSDFQVIVATTKDLDEEVERGTFLLDLRGRLTGLQIELPPLRERKEEMPLLVELALARQGIEVKPEVLAAIAERCAQYYWQGNVRQLFQVLNVLITEAAGQEKDLRPEDLPEFKTMLAPGDVVQQQAVSVRAATTSHLVDGDVVIAAARQALDEALAKDIPINDTVDAVEHAICQEAMKRHSSLRGVSEALGIARSTLSQKLIRWGLSKV